jgi:hypothetical protein
MRLCVCVRAFAVRTASEPFVLQVLKRESVNLTKKRQTSQ